MLQIIYSNFVLHKIILNNANDFALIVEIYFPIAIPILMRIVVWFSEWKSNGN